MGFWKRKKEPEGGAPSPVTVADASLVEAGAFPFRLDDAVFIREIRDLGRKHGYDTSDIVFRLNAPVQLEGGGTLALVSMEMKIHRWGKDPF
jgi:hypothetical protein